MNPKILHLLYISRPNLGGYSIRSHNILTFQKKFVDPCALTSPIYFRKKKKDIIGNVIYYRFPPNIGMNSFYDPQFFKRVKMAGLYYKFYCSILKIPLNYVRKIVKTQKIDIIHSHMPYSFANWGIKIAHENKLPFVYEVRGFWEESDIGVGQITRNSYKYWTRRKGETEIMRKSDAVVTLGKMMKAEIMSRSIDRQKIIIVPNGVNTKIFRPQTPDLNLKQKLGIHEKIVVGFVGSVRRIEGIDILIKAMKIVKSEIKDVVLLIVGPCNNEYRQELVKIIKKLKLFKCIHFTGQVPFEKVRNYRSIIDINIIPRIDSRVTRIVTPMKQLEVMSMEKVVLTSDLPALIESVKPGISGDLFAVGNYNDLAKKIIYYLSDRTVRKRLGVSARKFVKKNHDWKIIIEKYRILYEKLLS